MFRPSTAFRALLTTVLVALAPIAAGHGPAHDPPYVEITKPEAGATYVNNAELARAPPVSNGSAAVGKLTVQVKWACPKDTLARVLIGITRLRDDGSQGQNDTLSNTTQSASGSGNFGPYAPIGTGTYLVWAKVECLKSDRGRPVEPPLGSDYDERRVLWVVLT